MGNIYILLVFLLITVLLLIIVGISYKTLIKTKINITILKKLILLT